MSLTVMPDTPAIPLPPSLSLGIGEHRCTIAGYRQEAADHRAVVARHTQPSRQPHWCWHCRRQIGARLAETHNGCCSASCDRQADRRERDS